MDRDSLQDAVEESEQRRMLLVNRLKDAQDTLKVRLRIVLLSSYFLVTFHFPVQSPRVNFE